MKSLLNPVDKAEMLKRIGEVTPKDPSLWGKMNVHEMLVHAADQVRLSFGEKRSPYRGTMMTSTFVKFLVLLGMPIPKGKIETTAELKQGVGGTKLTAFEQDRAILSDMVNNFETKYGETGFRKHPVFGDLNKHQWGRLAYLHLNHHLKQFGR
ncbi:MAG: DUF1569 domain-containing protein [Ignavibacteriales bacterium]|nr:DUF1569 domain-containing protein [Ignavibacteriales bacterium]